MQPTLNIALRAARIAGEQIARAIERLDIIRSEQENITEFVNETVHSAEKTVAYHLQKANPQHRVIGHDSGEVGEAVDTADYEWRINAIDGRDNFCKSLPNFALTLVCTIKGRTEHVVVLNPITGEEFTASRGRGAQLNGKRIRVSNSRSLKGTLLGSSYFDADPDKKKLDSHLEIFKRVARQGALVQLDNCATLTLANIAAGRVDGGWFAGLSDWELEPALLLLQESGALSGDYLSGSAIRNRSELVTANPKLFKQLLQSIRPVIA